MRVFAWKTHMKLRDIPDFSTSVYVSERSQEAIWPERKIFQQQ